MGLSGSKSPLDRIPRHAAIGRKANWHRADQRWKSEWRGWGWGDLRLRKHEDRVEDNSLDVCGAHASEDGIFAIAGGATAGLLARVLRRREAYAAAHGAAA